MTAVCVRATPTIRHDHRQLSRRCVLAAGPFGALALAACAPPGSSTPPAETGKLGPATLQVLIGGGKDSQALLQDKLLPAFTERHPAVTIEYGPNINLTKKRALFAAGTGPDIFMNGAAQAPAVAEDKLAIPLDDRIKAWGKLSDFFPASLTASQWEGKQWGLPMMVAARTYVWRKNVLTEVGVSQTPVTWDDAAEASRRSTTVQDGQIAREGFNPPESYLLFIQSLLSTGKTLFRNGRAEFIGQEGITALQYLLDLHNAVRPPGATPPGGRSLDQFGNGVQAHGWYNMTAVRAVSQASPGDLDRIEVATPAVPGGKYRLPSGAKVRPIALNFSDWIALGSQSQAVDQAWEVMKYLLEPEPLLAYCESRYFQPPRKSVADKGFMKQSHLQKMVQIFEKFGHAQIRVPDQAVFSKTLRDMGTDVFSGKVSPQAGIEEAARILQNDIDKADFKTTL